MTDTPDTVSDVAPDRPLYKTTATAGHAPMMHLTADCRGLDDTNIVETKASEQSDERPICSFCNNSWSNPTKKEKPLCRQIEGAWADD